MYDALELVVKIEYGLSIASRVWNEEDTESLDAEEKAALKAVITILKETHASLLRVRAPLEKLLGDELPSIYRLC